MDNSKYRNQILELVKPYYDESDKGDFSHNSDHFFRVEALAKRMAKEENADIEVVEAASLIFDVARLLEDRGEIADHAEKGVEIAKEILGKIGFPSEKIENVCHSILSHRRSKDRVPETIEAKILRDADYLDAMGAVDIARMTASCLQSEKYKKPIYVDIPYDENKDMENVSMIHFLLYKLKHPKHQPDNFYTSLGKKLAKERFEYMKEFAERFISEWHGER